MKDKNHCSLVIFIIVCTIYIISLTQVGKNCNTVDMSA